MDCVAVDSTYLEDNTVFCGHDVISIEEALLKLDKCNVLIGFLGITDDKLNKLQLNNSVEKIFQYDGSCFYYFGLTYNQVENDLKRYLELYNNLEDGLSQDTLIAFINAKISGKMNYMATIMDDHQYFPNDIIKPTGNETFLDCGAFDGDTITQFLDITNGMYKKIYAFEPVDINFKKLQENFGNYPDILMHNCGVWFQKDTLRFADNLGTASCVSEEGLIEIEVDTIDNIIGNNEEVTFIKMDIEGSELEALIGAEQTIKRCKPKLAICVYHRLEDLLGVPKYLKEIVPEYRLYLRAHHYSSTEVVLYAV